MSSSARFDELKKKFDENPRRYFAPLANEFRKSGDAEQAVMICEEFLPQQPGHMSGHIVYGQALFDLGRLDDARTVFETALTLDPENLIALRHLGDISRAHGDLETARQWYQRVLEADPRNEEVQELIASVDSEMTTAPSHSEPPAAPSYAEPSQAEAGAPSFLEQVPTVDLAPAYEAPAAAPPPLPPTPQPQADSLLELDVVEEHALAAPPTSSAPAAPPPLPSAPAEPPFDSISLEGLEPTSAGSNAPEAPGRTEGFEPMEFTPPSAGTGNAGGIADQLEPGEFTAPPASVAPLDGLEETAIGAFEARPAAASPPPLPDLEPMPAVESNAASEQPPVDIPPEVIAAEAELIDERETFEPMPVEPPAAEPAAAEPAATEAATEAAGEAAPAASAPSQPTASESTPSETAPRATPSQPFVTETMAELYVKQGFREQALDVYKLLLAASPENQRLRDRVAELQAPVEADSGPNVREFFARLAARRPGESGAAAAAAAPPANDDFASFDSFETLPAETPPAETPPAETPTAESAPPAKGDGSIDALFGQRAGGSPDDSAASALAQAFGTGGNEPPPITGRPARAAAGELSLDSVFRDGGARPPRSAQSFSFDQFFSESAASEPAAEPGPSPTPSQGTAAQNEPEERSADDIEQFNSWLQGLKQR